MSECALSVLWWVASLGSWILELLISASILDFADSCEVCTTPQILDARQLGIDHSTLKKMRLFISICIAFLSVTWTHAFFSTPRSSKVLNRSIRSKNDSFQASQVSSRVTKASRLCMKYTLVLVRHGESTWNKENLFTGWYDCPLSEKGEKEAKAGGILLKEAGFNFDLAYTSTLKRAIKTLWLILEEMDLMYIPIKHTWRLNERHYGALQGMNKQETVDKYGKDQVLVWRRSYDIPPPDLDESSSHYPGNDPRYKDVVKKDLPKAESLKLTEARFMVDWHNVIVPEIKAGKKILIAAHGNTLRALVKHLDGISEKDIVELNIPTGVPLVYELDESLKPILQQNAIGPLSGRYLGNLEEIKARIGAVVAQTK